jgi:hypothetical protein
VGWLDQFQPFGEPASRFTSAIERENGRRDSNGLGTVDALKKSINVYKNACATLE